MRMANWLSDQLGGSGKILVMDGIPGVDTLRDIGAPDWVLAEASQRDEKRELYLIDLYRS